MQMKTNIAKVVEEVDTKARYDAAVKKVISDPQILGWILKYTVKEFSEYTISDIMACRARYAVASVINHGVIG